MTQPSIPPKPNAAPSDTSDEETNIDNFFANKMCFSRALFFAVLLLAGATICFSLNALNISHEHLNKTQQLLQEIKEGRDTTNETIKEIDSLRNSFSTHGFLLFLSLIALTSCFSKPIMKLLNKYPQRVFVAVIALGGFLAFSIPQYLYSFKYIGETKDITASLLTVTGGILAVFTLLKTHQKSELEREQLDTQKKKDDRDHIRQLHDSYNDRFDKAVAELNSNDVKAAYAAVPKLAKLADAWLDYEDLSNDTEELEKLKKKAKKEAQTIINILCKYIRTMPGEYTEEGFKEIRSLATASPDKLKSESEVRRLIFSEMSDRFSEDTFENKKLTTTPGVWNEFDFDFSRAPIFYPLNNLTIEKGIFTSAKFYDNADFRGTTFIRAAAFNGVEFAQGANFNEVTFKEAADFSPQGNTKTAFGGKATFNGTQFTQGANFNEVTFKEAADFSPQGNTKTAFGGKATFNGTQFTQGANFNEVTFKEAADFSPQGNTKTAFGGKATFNGTQFTQDAYFSEVTFNEVTFNESADLSIRDDPKTVFEGEAVFNDATFNKKATFHGVHFKKVASFNSVLFCKNACFKYAIFKNSSSFTIKDTGCRKTEFKESANFQSTLFEGKTSFKGAIFNGRANFYPNQLDVEDMKFAQEADFSYAHFMKGAHFLKVEFEGDALFGFSKFHEDKTHEILNKPDEDLTPYERVLIRSSMTHTAPEIYTGTANFFDTKFHGVADFMFAEFTGESIFTSAKFYRRTSFENSYIYEKIAFSGKFGRINISASFSNKNNPDDYNFDSKKEDRSGNKLYIIEKDEFSYGDKKFYVPKGCKLFDPEASKDLFGNYKQSEPAKPLENSDTEEEKPTA